MTGVIKPANRLLAALPAAEYARMLPQMQEVPLNFAQLTHEQNKFVRNIYFLNSGIVSLILAVEERSRLEVGIVGSEGFVGLSVFHGAKQSNNRRLFRARAWLWR